MTTAVGIDWAALSRLDFEPPDLDVRRASVGPGDHPHPHAAPAHEQRRHEPDQAEGQVDQSVHEEVAAVAGGLLAEAVVVSAAEGQHVQRLREIARMFQQARSVDVQRAIIAMRSSRLPRVPWPVT